MGFELFVALRYLKAKRRQAAISLITVISVLGVAAGVSALVVALSVNNGFKSELEKKLLGAVTDVNLIRVKNDGIRHYNRLTERLSKLPHVVAAAPAIYEEVLISSRQRAQGAVLKGIEPKREVRVGALLRHLSEGSLQGLSQTFPHADPIILGKDLAKSLGVFVGDTVTVTSPQGALTPFGTVPKFQHFRVVGVFDSGFYDFDSSWAFTSLAAAQQLFDLENVVSDIEFKIDNVYLARSVAGELRRKAGPGFETTTWMEQNQSLLHAMNLERLVTILTIGLIVLVAALNIFITLTMMVMEKNRDIAVLMSMGARPGQVSRIFKLYGLAIGSLGTVFGLALGYGISWAGQRYHLFPISPQVYSLAAVPFHPRIVDGLWIAAAAVTISFLATLYPARAAAALNPAEVLRYE